jgi:hypothetical protein
MNTTTPRRFLNEAFKRFQPLPDWPIEEIAKTRATQITGEAKETRQERSVPDENTETQFISVFTG